MVTLALCLGIVTRVMTTRPLHTDSPEFFLNTLDPEATAVLVAKRMAVEDTSESNLPELREQVGD